MTIAQQLAGAGASILQAVNGRKITFPAGTLDFDGAPIASQTALVEELEPTDPAVLLLGSDARLTRRLHFTAPGPNLNRGALVIDQGVTFTICPPVKNDPASIFVSYIAILAG